MDERFAEEVSVLCSGPGFSLVNVGDEERILAKNYKCIDCNNNFKGVGVLPVCPQCESKKVKRVK
ncbi:MAG: hypothetical protein MUO26_04405 [Methanotrichaceae archaeon]|nr:hypothetical protein [Methanotrichaceae archaeon]